MKIALLGANGQLGRDLRQALIHEDVVPFTSADFDVVDHPRSCAAISEHNPAIIINTTAYHRVDDCESRSELAFQTNALAVLNLVRIANDLGAVLVHISTDYVFDGKSNEPYTEESAAMPLSVYANSKLSGEYFVRSNAHRYFLIRTSGLYGKGGSRKKGGNFIEIMLEKARKGEDIQVVNDQVLTPTYTLDLAQQIAAILPTTHYGLFHMTNEGSCSWYEFARNIFQFAGIEAKMTPTTSELYRTPAIRPRYSVLENARLKSLGMNRMRHWRDALAAYFQG